MVERMIQQRRDDHSAERGDRGKDRLSERAQLAVDELALDLHSDDEEENRHQTVVHELQQREPGDRLPDADREGRLEHRAVRGDAAEVRPRERGEGAREEHDPARRLEPEECLDRRSDGPEHGWHFGGAVARGVLSFTNPPRAITSRTNSP
jgi:hypothetical protein